MSFAKTIALATLYSVAMAASEEDKKKFPTAAANFDHYKVDWEHDQINSDGYNIDVFHITGFTDMGPIEVTKPPLIAIHPMGGNSDFWTDPGTHMLNLPMMLQAAASGFDVWLWNARGTSYGLTHDEYDYTQPEFWDFTFFDIGTKDIAEMVRHVREVTGEKPSLFGYSQGTTNLLAGIAGAADFFGENANVIGLQAPCGVINKVYTEPIYKKEFIDFFKDNKIYVLGGPTPEIWEESKKIMCQVKELCDLIPSVDHL